MCTHNWGNLQISNSTEKIQLGLRAGLPLVWDYFEVNVCSPALHVQRLNLVSLHRVFPNVGELGHFN